MLVSRFIMNLREAGVTQAPAVDSEDLSTFSALAFTIPHSRVGNIGEYLDHDLYGSSGMEDNAEAGVDKAYGKAVHQATTTAGSHFITATPDQSEVSSHRQHPLSCICSARSN